MTEREVITVIRDEVANLGLKTRGPFTTLYWSAKDGDNVTQQQLTVTIGEQTFEILVREKK